jgi:hypothetical protein
MIYMWPLVLGRVNEREKYVVVISGTYTLSLTLSLYCADIHTYTHTKEIS